ncbi:MAG: sensor histidine kinase [Stackebrandtia sp.]
MSTRWHTLPLRVRLVALGMGGLLFGFAVGGMALVFSLHYVTQKSVDATATETADNIAALLEEDKLPDPIATGRESTIVQIYDAEGRFERGSLGADPLVPLLKDYQMDDALDEGAHFTVPGNRASMSTDLRVTAAPAGERVVVVGVSRSELNAVPKFAKGLAVMMSALAATVAVVLWWLVGRTLRPVEAARTKQRAFVADAAHELRSPLANMRTELEVAERVGAPPELLHDLLADVERLSRMTEDLLLLSRLDDARRPVRPQDLDLAELVGCRVAEYSEARVPVVADLPEASVEMRADADAVRRILTNLVDNAVRHAETRVTVTCRVVDGGARITVSDDGPGVPADDRARVFNRFTRLDDARGRDSGGAGLGLPITAELVAAHGGSIELRDASPRGLRAEVRLAGL